MNANEKRKLFIELFKEDLEAHGYRVKKGAFYRIDMNEQLLYTVNMDLARCGFLNTVQFGVASFTRKINEHTWKYGFGYSLTHYARSVEGTYGKLLDGPFEDQIELSAALWKKYRLVEKLAAVTNKESCAEFNKSMQICIWGEELPSHLTHALWANIAMGQYGAAGEYARRAIAGEQKRLEEADRASIEYGRDMFLGNGRENTEKYIQELETIEKRIMERDYQPLDEEAARRTAETIAVIHAFFGSTLPKYVISK